MTDEVIPVENLPRVIGPGTDETVALQIKDVRATRETRARLLGGPAVEVNATIDRLTDATNDADAALITLARPGETLIDIMARVDADDYATDRERSLVNASRSSRMSLENEKRVKRDMAEEFQTESFDNDVVEFKQAYETAMSTEVERVSRRWNIPRVDAMKLVDKDIATRGQAVVLPIFHRIYSRFMAAHPQQEVIIA